LVGGRNSSELGNPSTVEFSEFRQLGQQRADGHRPQPFDGVEDFDFTSIDRVGLDTLGEPLIDCFDLFLWSFQGFFDVSTIGSSEFSIEKA
jgi:hypothetical protein